MNTDRLRSVRRRYHLLLALRWVPSGLFVTVFVLLMRQRGLSLAQIGLGTAAQGLVMLVLELPSGGLADALGRKPVLVVAGSLAAVASAVLLVTDSVALLALAYAIYGVFRALDSGPLQAWLVDEVLATDADADIERDLGRGEITIGFSIALGALTASGIVRTGGPFGLDPLVVPLALALVLQVLGVIAVVALLDERRSTRGWTAARASIAEVPAVVRRAVGIVGHSHLLTALVVGELLWGFGMVAFETFFPARLGELDAGGADAAAGAVGPVLTAAWILSAVGAAGAPALVRRFGSAWTGSGLRVAHGAAVVAMGLAGGPGMLIACYLANYAAHGASNPVHYGMVHRAVDSAHRATVVSANSLTSQVGGALSGIALGALADTAGIPTAMVVAGVVLAAAAPLYLVGRSRPAAPSFEEPATLPVGPAGASPARR